MTNFEQYRTSRLVSERGIIRQASAEKLTGVFLQQENSSRVEKHVHALSKRDREYFQIPVVPYIKLVPSYQRRFQRTSSIVELLFKFRKIRHATKWIMYPITNRRRIFDASREIVSKLRYVDPRLEILSVRISKLDGVHVREGINSPDSLKVLVSPEPNILPDT